MTIQLEGYRTEEWVAAWLEVSVRTLRRWVEKGTFPKPHRLSEKALRWPVSVLAKWQSKQSSDPLVSMRFRDAWGSFNAGEVAGFDCESAATLWACGIADLIDDDDLDRIQSEAARQLREIHKRDSEIIAALGSDDDDQDGDDFPRGRWTAPTRPKPSTVA